MKNRSIAIHFAVHLYAIAFIFIISILNWINAGSEIWGESAQWRIIQKESRISLRKLLPLQIMQKSLIWLLSAKELPHSQLPIAKLPIMIKFVHTKFYYTK